MYVYELYACKAAANKISILAHSLCMYVTHFLCFLYFQRAELHLQGHWIY